MEGSREIHVFDLDNTLIQLNSSLEFGAYLYKQGILPFFKMLSLIRYYGIFKIGGSSIEALHQNICKTYFSGQSISEVEGHVERYVACSIEASIYPPAYQKLCDAIKRGHYTALLSSAPGFLVKQFASYFKVDEWAATHYHSVDDRIVEVSFLMNGIGKAFYINNLMTKMKVERKNVWAYSDSFLDLPFLEAAGHSVGVNPDRALRSHCKKQDWVII